MNNKAQQKPRSNSRTRSFNPLAAALIIVAASAVVIGYCINVPENARMALIIYVCTMVCATLILAISGWIYKNKKTSVDEKDIIKITENLNTEKGGRMDRIRHKYSRSHSSQQDSGQQLL